MITPEENQPAKTAASLARDFAPYLAQASEVLASSLDYQATLTSLANLVVPDLADWCGIDMVGDDGSFTRLAVAHEDPEKVAWARELQRRYPPGADTAQGVPQVLRSGKAEFYPEVTDEMLVAAARDDEHLRLVREVGFTSMMIVPLVARKRTLGTISLVSAESGRRYEPGDLALAEDLARRAALAVDNARLYREAQREISDRRRAEEELRESEARFRAVYESSPIGIANVRADGCFVQTNRAFQGMLGYSADELGSMTFDEVTHPEDVAESREVLGRLVEGERDGVSFEKRYRQKDGCEIWCRLTVSAVRDASGRFLYTVSMNEDITERKKAEQEVRESEERFRSLVANSSDMVTVFAADGTRLYASPSTEHILGYTPDNALGGDASAVIHPDDLPKVSEELAERARTPGTGRPLEFRVRHADGSWRFLESVGTNRLEDPSVGGIVFNARDVTERKRAEEELKESRRTLATLMSNLPGMAYRCRNEPGWTMELVSEGCTDLTGHPSDALVGNPRISYGDLIHPDDRERVWEKVQAGIEERCPFQVTYRITTATGAVKWVWEQGRGVFSPEGELLALEGFVTDQTERVQAFQLLEERLTALTRIAASLTVDRRIETTLDTLAAGVVEGTTAIACSVVLIDEETGMLRLAGSHGLPDGYTVGMEASWRAGAQSPTIEAFRAQEPLLIREARQLLLDNPLYAPIHPYLEEVSWDTVSIVPLVARGRALGAINVYYLPEQEPTEEELTFLGAIADQTAVAVESTRLFAESQGKAALEERQRLARELHDSVSQALYGIALGSKTARTLLDRDPDRVAEPLDYVRSLAEAGLAEMRALIFELRPESLENEGLIAALEKQMAALRARHEILVRTNVRCEEPDVPLEAKEALYRIAQEALHNTVKHAHANSVNLELKCDEEGVRLEIGDDGVGFDLSRNFPGHLGLHSMRERAERLGGTLEVESAPGQGTHVRVRLPFAT